MSGTAHAAPILTKLEASNASCVALQRVLLLDKSSKLHVHVRVYMYMYIIHDILGYSSIKIGGHPLWRSVMGGVL